MRHYMCRNAVAEANCVGGSRYLLWRDANPLDFMLNEALQTHQIVFVHIDELRRNFIVSGRNLLAANDLTDRHYRRRSVIVIGGEQVRVIPFPTWQRNHHLHKFVAMIVAIGNKEHATGADILRPGPMMPRPLSC